VTSRQAALWFLAAIGIVIAGCSSASVREGAGANDLTSTSALAPAPTPPIDPIASWTALAEEENAYSASEIAEASDGLYGMLVAPTLRLFKFVGSAWVDVTAQSMLDVPSDKFDYDITIQSEFITSDGVLDFVVNFSPAPWHILDVPNQGRDVGIVISSHRGTWQSQTFFNTYDASESTTVEHIMYVNGGLYGDGYGSCGRPCGTLLFTWVNGTERFEGIDATKAQIRSLPKPWCSSFTYNESLPLKRCDEGGGVRYLQTALSDLGYELEADGYFGDGTRFSVQHFQRAKALRATGRVDLETWKALFDGVSLPGYDLNGDGAVTPNEFSGG
jgi:hypothetical protein